MEFLPTNLTSSIEQHGILPKEISYSILHDVALGLYYLHGQTPSIIHRDLSSNNVLLTTNMMAKISDLGVARILNLTALQVSRMTGTPGTPAYMPPEVMAANPRYGTCVDEFSYGILMIHMFSGRWPEPQVGPSHTELDGTMTLVSEAERRKVFLRAIGSDHPLMDLILNCINNHPQARIHANKIVERLAEMVLQFPATFAGRMEMLRQALADAKEKRDLAEEIQRKDMVIQQNEYQISQLGEELHAKEAKKITEIDQLKVSYSSEMEQLRLQIRDLNTQSQLMKAEDEAEITELKAKAKALENQIENTTKILLQFEAQLVNERVENRKLTTNLSKVQSDLTRLNSKLQSEIAERDATIQMKDASVKRKDSEIEARTRALEEKDATISAMSKQLNKAREYLTTKKQAPQASITWNKCTELPVHLGGGNAIVISGKVYFGGRGDFTLGDTVYCYDPSRDKWTTLPPLPVRSFGLGQVNSKLVAVGGMKMSHGMGTNDVYTYDAQSRKWKQTIDPMPTARCSPGVLSLESALVVAGGYTHPSYKAAVEIFKPDTPQWYRTNPLPVACCGELVAIGDIVYAIGEIKDPSHPSHVFYAAVDDLFSNTVPGNQTTYRNSSSNAQSAWKALPNTPTYQPAAAVLAGNLLTIGGKETSELGSDTKREVYMYSSSINSWIYISDLPVARYNTAVAILSSTAILVIGGKTNHDYVNTVYMGILTMS